MKYLNQLRRLPENKRCATCPYEDRMGFKDVCMKYKIFICGDCKSAHQSFSHRCKARSWNILTSAQTSLSTPSLLPFGGSVLACLSRWHAADDAPPCLSLRSR